MAFFQFCFGVTVAMLAVAVSSDDVESPKWSRVVWSARRAHLECELPGSRGVQDLMKPPLERKVPPHLAMLEPSTSAPMTAPQITWLWWRQGEQINSGRISDDGTLDVRGRKAEGNYSCAVKGPAGTVRGFDTQLKFASMANDFERHPSSQEVQLGQPFLLVCEIESKPSANITWEKDGKPLRLGNSFHSPYSGEILITDSKRSDEGSYRCIATNSHVNNTKVRYSDVATVKILDGDDIIQPRFLDARISRNNVLEGEDLLLPCVVVARPKVKVSWEFVGESTNAISSYGNDPFLKIGPLKLEDSGKYICKVPQYDMVKQYQIRVIRPPRIVLKPNSTSIHPAGKARFNCTASGDPSPKITWLKDGRPLSIENKIRIISHGSTSPELLISGASTTDAGVYQCIAENEGGIDSDWAILSVWGTNEGPAPRGLRCYPLNPTTVRLVWQQQPSSLAYTIHFKKKGNQEDNKLTELPTFEYGNLEPYVLYNVTVRSYTNMQASIFSPDVECGGQGVPITIRRENAGVTVYWKPVPGATEYRLQGRIPDSYVDLDVKIDAGLDKYTLADISPTMNYELRLLVTLDGKWLTSDLDFLPWTSTTTGQINNNIVVSEQSSCQVPTDLSVDNKRGTNVRVSWTCNGGDGPYKLCYKTLHPLQVERCLTVDTTYVNLDLEPETEYTITVQVQGRPRLSDHLVFKTPNNPDQNGLKSVKWSWEGQNLILTWSLIVHHPTSSNDDSSVIEDESTEEINMKAASVPMNNFTVGYSQNLIQPLHEWTLVNVTNNTQLTIPNLKPVQTYVLVCAGLGALSNAPNVSLGGNTYTKQTPVCVGQTIPSPPPESLSNYAVYIAVGACTVGIVLCIAAALIWKRKKTRATLPSIRHSDLAANDSLANWETVELKGSSRACRNGGNSRSVDEPLLNGRLDAPASLNTTANGSVYSDVIDVSRRPDVTLTSLLSASPLTPHKRRDDNMNCQASLTPT